MPSTSSAYFHRASYVDAQTFGTWRSPACETPSAGGFLFYVAQARTEHLTMITVWL